MQPPGFLAGKSDGALPLGENLMDRRTFLAVASSALSAQAAFAQSPGRRTENILFITTDGLRWEDVFRGADPALINKEFGGVSKPEALKERFWKDSPAERREVLMPFIWKTVAKHGQLFGNRDRGSDAYVTNGKNFSYPGYSELLTGAPDDRIDSNDAFDNPNVNVLEWLNTRETFRNQIAAFGAWERFRNILNAKRSGLLVNDGYTPLQTSSPNARIDLLNRMKIETGVWDAEPFDAPVFLLAKEYLRTARPRILYLGLGETDEWAHEGRYDLYLNAANRVDRYIEELWNLVQSLDQYRERTTLILGVDHGRGEKGKDWRGHGQKIPESKYVWMGVMGPDTPALGERSSTPPITQSQIAGTLAALLGEDYHGAFPETGKPIAEVIKR